MRSRFKKLLGLSALGLCSYFAVTTILFTMQAKRSALTQTMDDLPILPAPKPSSRPLIIAPHPDDETLGCGGLLAMATAVGADARILFLTDGDGYSAPAMFLAGRPPSPEDYRELGQVRRREAQAAARELGLQSSQVRFLGMPDRGLMAMAQSGREYISPYTQLDQYAGRPYRLGAMIEAVAASIADHGPTEVYTTHPLDDHADHVAAAFVVEEAMRRVKSRGLLDQECRMIYYIVHRGDWPQPMGHHPELSLLPPKAMVDAGYQWAKLPLTPEALAAKEAALKRHQSQRAVSGKFLNSFVRRNELFVLPEAEPPKLPALNSVIDGNPDEPVRLVHQDPSDDDAARRLQPGADICEVYAGRDKRGLYISVKMRGDMGPQCQMRVDLIAFGATGNETRTTHTFSALQTVRRKNGVRAASRGQWFEARIPVSTKPGQALYLQLSSQIVGVKVDQSGFVRLPD